MSELSEPPTVLDPRQLERIEGVHRGFLYQHLYAAGCLLLASKAGAIAVLVERDEDIEVQLAGRRVYVQVKTRSKPLLPSDIQNVLERFAELRKAHASGARQGIASFWIVCNSAPGPSLVEATRGAQWPVDVTLRWPGREGREEPALPPAWDGTSNAVVWCAEFAATLPFAALLPETLVWKLAGFAALAASGGAPYTDHLFTVADLPTLFEQLVFRLQDFPVIPPHYRPQANEPGLASDRRVRLICGFSGAGKTAWASQAALHVPYAAAYFDAAEVPGPTVAASLVRELAGRLVGMKKGRLGEILLPGASGIEMLRLLDDRLDRDVIDAVVVIDNAHRVPTDNLRAVAESTRRLRLVLLCQPGSEVQTLQSRLGIPDEQLAGWTEDTIAAEAADSGCRADYATCNRLLRITGGLPLYVQSAVRVAASAYAGDLAKLCTDIEAQTHLVPTSQETILARHYDTVAREAKDVLAVLSIADCPLTNQEASTLASKALPLALVDFAKTVRSLVTGGFIHVFGNARLKVHDAVRVLGRARIRDLGETVLRTTQLALKDILSASLREERDTSRFALFIRLLELTDDVETLIDLASNEMFHEMGLAQDFALVLEDAAARSALSPAQRFWALDALAFAELKNGDVSRLPQRMSRMEQLVGENGLGRREVLALGMKRMLYAAGRGDADGAQKALHLLSELIPDDPAYLRIVKYNAACAMHMIGRHGPAKALALGLAEEYYDHLGLDIGDVLAKNPDDIWPLLKQSDTLGDDLKHLADCLDLSARSSSAIGEDSGFARVHAFKFYAMANAVDSALKVGQDLVDEFIGRGDPVGARQVLEGSLLPSAIRAKMVDRIVPLRGQYAVVLAHCGEFAAAEAEMARLVPYESGLPDIGRKELRNQRRLIESLRDAQARQGLPASQLPERAKKIGRNEPCPCGSGRKYKKCHGTGV